MPWKVKAIIPLGVLLIAISSCAGSRPWTKTEKGAAGFFLLGKAADWYTTERVLDNPNYYELNPMLGKHPSDMKLAFYFPITSLIVLGICHYHPELRILLLSLYGAVNWSCAKHNWELLKEQ